MELFYLDQDDDGHWYIVPRDKRKAFEAYVASAGDEDLPAGIREVGGAPQRVLFTNPEIEQ